MCARRLIGALHHAVALHERAEQVGGLPHHLRIVFLDGDHGQAGVGIHGHHVGDGRTQRKALDAAGELLCQQQRRIQGRLHRGIVLGGNENGLPCVGAPLVCRLVSGSCGDHTATYSGPIERLGIDRLLAQRVRSPS